MLLSLTVLGETQNLSAAVEILGVSRQTIRRHIRELENLTGQVFFEAGVRHYRLTQHGELAITQARKLIDKSNDWLAGRLTTSFQLLNSEIVVDDDSWLYAQQHPFVSVWSLAPPILQRGAEFWIKAKGEITHSAFDQIRPYILVYRKYRGEWLVVEVGDKSAYATWLGVSLAKSELGRKLNLGEKFKPIVKYWRKPYDAVLANGGFWYEHISINVPKHIGEPSAHANYQRLLAAGTFADGQPAVMVFAARTNTMDIPRMPEIRKRKMAREHLMEFEI